VRALEYTGKPTNRRQDGQQIYRHWTHSKIATYTYSFLRNKRKLTELGKTK
jgi:hypothetical protein